MINTLLTPELRELIEKKDYDSLRDFCSSTDPCTVAEFIGALTPDDLMKILLIIDSTSRSEIIECLDQDIRTGLASFLKGETGSGYGTHAGASERFGLLKSPGNTLYRFEQEGGFMAGKPLSS